MKPFVCNEYPTIGVEEEFHLIDPVTAELSPRVEAVLAVLGDDLQGLVCRELFTSVIEANSIPADTAGQLVDNIIATRRRLAAACQRAGVLMVAAGTHPFSHWRDQQFIDSDHYRWVRDNHGAPARRMLSFGLHIHVGLTGADEALYVMHEMRRWTYPLMALGANSPFLAGEDAGLASARMHIFGSMPRTCMPPDFATPAELDDIYNKLVATGDIEKPGDLWWALRPQPPLGTLEIRSIDLPTDVHRIGALTALYQGAAAVYQDQFRDGRPRSTFKDEYIDQNRWRAMRDGINATIIEPETGEIISMIDQLTRMLDLAQPKADQLGGADYLALARKMLATGNEADLQRQRFAQLNDLRQLELDLARRTLTFE